MTNTETRIDAGDVTAEAHVPGFTFYRDTKKVITARCDRCYLGFVVRTPFTLRHRMIEHLDRGHGRGNSS